MFFFTESNLELTMLEKDSGLVTAEGHFGVAAGTDPTFVEGIGDCASSMMCIPSTDHMKVDVLVRESAKASNTKVHSILTRTYLDSLTNSYTTAPCNSTGCLSELFWIV